MDPKHFEKPVPLWHNPTAWRIRDMIAQNAAERAEREQ